MTLSGRSGFRGILDIRAFRLLWLSQLLALTAQNGIHFVQLVLIERLTGRSTHIGLMVVAFSLPPVLFSFFSGAVIDRVPKKWVISLSNISRALLSFAYVLVLQTWHGTSLLWAVYVITFIASAIGVFNNPAVLAKLPLVVGEDKLMRANSMFNVTIAASQIVGLIFLAPLAVKGFGITGGFVVMGLCYLLGFLFDVLLPRDEVHRTHTEDAMPEWKRAWVELKDGWRFVGRSLIVSVGLLQLTLVATLVMILAMAAPGLSSRVLGLSPEDAVFIFAPAGIGMLVAMVLLGRWGGNVSPHWLQTGLLLLTAGGFAVLGLISGDYKALHIPALNFYPERFVSLPMMVSVTAFALGAAMYGVLTVAQTAVQRATPASLRGRVFTVQFMLTNLVGMVPLLAAASVADILGLPEMMRWLAYSCLAVAVISLLATARTSAKPAGRVSSDLAASEHPTESL